MEKFSYNIDNVEECAARAAEVLRAGGVVLYPTDTLYGLGADARSDEAVEKIKRIKGRDEGKPIHAIVSDLAMVERYAEVNAAARALAQKLWPGSLTLIFKKKRGVDAGIARGIDSFGARAANHSFCLALAREFGAPFTGTSANKSGQKPERSIEKVLAQLGDVAEAIDLIIDAGELPASLPSTVVDVRDGAPRILREGTIPAAAIQGVVGGV